MAGSRKATGSSLRRAETDKRKQRDQETISVINSLLAEREVDITRLRKIAAVRGLANDGLRTRVWPLLLGLQTGAPHNAVEYASRNAVGHADSHVVSCDMERSLWSFTEGWQDEERQERREALRRVLDGAIAGNVDDTFYYQGLHDIAAVLLFVCGERLAWRMLTVLVTCHLRDCTRRDLAAATEMLRLLYPILEACDPGLHAYIQGLREPALEVPYFALSWYMTWFAHDVSSQASAARLFDLFLSSHPLMPLYVAAVALKDSRDRILACADDGLEVYSTLKRLQILTPGCCPDADALAREAAALYQAVPPAALMRRKGIQLQQSVAVHAYLEGGRWHVPPQPQISFAQRSTRQLALLFAPQQSPPKRHRARQRAIALLAGMTSIAAVGVAVLLVQLQPWSSASTQWPF